MHALAASCEELRARTGNPPLDQRATIEHDEKLVVFASRAHTNTEFRYSKTEREALQVRTFWHISMFVNGQEHFGTDHKPLEIFS